MPAVVFHTQESEQAHPAIDDHVFELLPASLEPTRVPEHVRALMARWHRFEELKNSAATLQRLESTTDLVYFDFRPDTGNFRPSPQLRQILGLVGPTESMAPGSLLDRMHSDDRALFAGTLFEAARSGTPFCVPIRLTDAEGRQRHFRTRGRAFGPAGKGHSSWIFGVCEDTTEHMQRLAEAEARSRVDELTGLGNRRYFDDCLTSALGRAKRERTAARTDLRRPRPLQADQRHPRPRRGRPAVAGDRGASVGCRARARPRLHRSGSSPRRRARLATRRRRVHGAPLGYPRTRRRRARREAHARCDPRAGRGDGPGVDSLGQPRHRPLSRRRPHERRAAQARRCGALLRQGGRRWLSLLRQVDGGWGSSPPLPRARAARGPRPGRDRPRLSAASGSAHRTDDRRRSPGALGVADPRPGARCRADPDRRGDGLHHGPLVAGL